MTIEINNESALEVEIDRVLKLSRFALEALKIHPKSELAIVFVDEPAMAKLHDDWMGESGPTDVLSFPMDELRPGVDGVAAEPGLLGDIVVCPQVAAAQATSAGHSVSNEICLLITHGILHLLGFDHAEPEEEREMFALQNSILADFYAQEA